MSRQHELRSYIARVQVRLRVLASLRGTAMLAATALVATVVLASLLNHIAFPVQAVTRARLALWVAMVLCAALGLVWPLARLTRKRSVERAEAAHPELEQRLTTFHERFAKRAGDESDPFLELLAADTLRQTEASAPPSSLGTPGRLLAFTGAALACVGVLVWMIAATPGYLGYGASLLWTGPKKNIAPLYAIAVTPGDVAVRRHADQLVSARITGLKPEKVQLFAHFQSAAGWEPVTMQPQLDTANTTKAAGYQFLLAGLPEDVEYYVAAGPLLSPHYKVRVVDLPAVKSVQVTYHYPKWTGLKPVTEDHAGDLRAIEGTEAALDIEMDRPIAGAQRDGQLLLDNGKPIQLTAGGGNHYKAMVHMEKDGAYHVAAVDAGQPVRLSEDYFIATDKAAPPEVAIDRPGRDYRASPIEEVTVGVKAADAFGVRDMRLHYSVNGGPEREANLLKTPGTKSAEGSYTVRLEDFKLVPGDLVSLYATARDGHAEARTDMTFIQADPFEREFSQSQQSGGGGGGGGGSANNQTEISKREKELIAATWKQVNEKSATAKDAAAQGQFLADAQTKLRDQVMALSARMGTRDLSAANEEFSAFEKDMQAAASTMAPSADKLKGMQWKDALPLEQKTLQSLLRAEATFRQIQVAFGQQSGGGGGGGSSAGRDLASLFDLELDTEKNQYETAQTASPAEQHAKDVESALEKLDALAKRQEELAKEQHNPQQSFAERWQQEMLRREAEQLQREMEQLAENHGGGTQQGGQQSSQQSAQQSSQRGKERGSQQGSSSGSGGSQQQASLGSGSQSGSPSSSQNGSESGDEQQAQSQSGGQTASRGAKQPGARSSDPRDPRDPRIAEALSRLRQAGEAMKRSGSAQGNSEAAQQAAAERLREAAGALGSAHQQLATGKVDSLSHEADRLAEEERAQADRIAKLASRATEAMGTDGASMAARSRERNQLAADRQQLSNDLSGLQKSLRDTARQVAPAQPGVAGKLRDALTEMDQTDLDNHVQRTADWLRRGVNPNSNGTENEIAQGLQKLAGQLHQAQQGMGQPGSKSAQGRGGENGGKKAADEVAALGQVERLRSQLETMAAARRRDGSQGGNPERGGQPGNRGQEGRQGQRGGAQGSGQNGAERSPATAGRGQAGTGQERTSEGGNQARGGPAMNQGSQQGQGAANGQGSAAARGGPASGAPGSGANTGALRNGEVRSGGGSNAEGTVWGNINTGNNTYAGGGQRPASRDASGNPADTERTFQQGMRELNELRQTLGGDPAASKELSELTRQMQRLDPKRFPGNPALVEQMHREVLSAVDRLELELNRGGSTEAHTGKPAAIPSGYEQSVANYYRELSARH